MTTNISTIRVTIGIYTISARYTGGAYIDLYWGEGALNPDTHTPFEVINVYDYKAGKTTIVNTPAGVKGAVNRWRKELGNSPLEVRATLDNYYRNTR